jgi:hypothetical protein
MNLQGEGRTVYDSATGVHWLADADLAADPAKNFGVTGINQDGSMTWSQAVNWIAGMNSCNNGNGYLGHTNWTMPGLNNPSNNGGFDQTESDLGELFYGEFGGLHGESISDLANANTQLFKHFQPYLYWDRDFAAPGHAQFSFGNGFQGSSRDDDVMYVLPEYPDATVQAPTLLPPKSITLEPPSPVFPPMDASPDGKILYDRALDISWLADANLAKTHPFDIPQGYNPDVTAININPDGSMNYATAVQWIDAMNARDYLGHNNWRLPMAQDASAGYNIAGGGIGDEFSGSEMGELYYTELGSQAGSTVLRTHNSNETQFQHFQPYLYWAGTQTHTSRGNGHSTFSFGSGFQGANIDTNEMYVIPVFDGPRTVTNNVDLTDSFGHPVPGSLRSVILAAHAGDTIKFASTLASPTITLESPISINVDNEGQYEALDIEGPGADQLALSGANEHRIFAFTPAPMGAAMTTIAGLTLENGQSVEGGAIYDDGASLTLRSDIFSNDMAVSAPTTVVGAAAPGGALAILADSTDSTNVTVTDCQFNNDAAIGGAARLSTGGSLPGEDGEGGAVYLNAGTSSRLTLSISGTNFTGDSATGGSGADGGVLLGLSFAPTDGGAGDGGAVYVAADHASSAHFSFSNDTFSDCTATGGNGGNGTADVSGQRGANGGPGNGGAFFYTAGVALQPSLDMAASSFTSNSATAGKGGTGGNATGKSGHGGAGGDGGRSLGGALFVNFANSTGGTVALAGNTISFNAIHAGAGGNGGDGGNAGSGGAGGHGGLAGGGAQAVIVSGRAVGTALTVAQSGIYWNTAYGGNGGAGGAGQVGGKGGNGAGARGAGLYLDSMGGNGADIWNLTAVVLGHNDGYSGNGGNGGFGSQTGGDGGTSRNSYGGGIYDAFAGTLDLYQCTVEFNALFDGLGGTGGASPGAPGANGHSRRGAGGGLFIRPNATALATTDTVIADNLADNKPDANSALGRI